MQITSRYLAVFIVYDHREILTSTAYNLASNMEAVQKQLATISHRLYCFELNNNQAASQQTSAHCSENIAAATVPESITPQQVHRIQ